MQQSICSRIFREISGDCGGGHALRERIDCIKGEVKWMEYEDIRKILEEQLQLLSEYSKKNDADLIAASEAMVKIASALTGP